MFSWVAKLASALWLPISLYARTNKDDSLGDDNDPLLWFKDLEKHAFGEYSFSVVQANEVLEDHSQVEIGQNATFVGIYDGHGGPEASRYICDHLFPHLIRLAREKGLISSEILKNAVSATENGFLSLVRRTCGIKPLMAAVGSCCLAGLITEGTLYVANMGDSRAVIGCLSKRKSNKIVAEQITEDHNACMDEIRQELKQDHPDDPHIVVMKQGVWRIKGIIQVSRTIGDAYLKKPEFALDSSFPRFHLREPIRRPILKNGPSMYTRTLRPDDKFIVFASDGLWEHMTNQQVVEIVHNNPRSGIARRLVKSAMMEAARKGKKKYEEVKRMEKGCRRGVHDDITVAVVFMDQQTNVGIDELSMRGFTNSTAPSSFGGLQGVGRGS
uniref:probable protein phosphatase 2C 43 n=1 Tax=Erigeron canadensis TaxID=72917 RepID=UPI001CB915DC|nr:probable protein phosphatase 2C 43 [Erigeron canadensis]